MSDKPTLLIVDDDPLIADTLSYALGKDFKVLTSDSRTHAVSLLRRLDDAPQLAPQREAHPAALVRSKL
jgi:ActR/RegA family two-component response regulator